MTTEPTWKEHHCDKLPRGVWIYHNPGSETMGLGWWVWMKKEAVEADLETGTEINEVGQTIWENQVEVAFCPWCGVRLLEGDPPEGYGRFCHTDFRTFYAEFLEGP